MEDKRRNRPKDRIRLEPRIRGTGKGQEREQEKQESIEIKTFDVDKFIRKNIIRLVISVIIFAILFAIRSIPLSTAQKITQGIRWAVSWEEDFIEKRNIIPVINTQIQKFIGGGEEKVVGEIEEDGKYISPVDGVITSPFEEGIHPVFKTKIEAKGVEISGDSARDIRAIERGKVLKIQDSVYGGKRIVIEHEGALTGVYEGCYDVSLEVNQEISQGDILGKTKSVDGQMDSIFYFELWKGDTAVNPSNYIDLQIQSTS